MRLYWYDCKFEPRQLEPVYLIDTDYWLIIGMILKLLYNTWERTFVYCNSGHCSEDITLYTIEFTTIKYYTIRLYTIKWTTIQLH